MREYAAQNREHRQKVLQVLKDSGINIGALITTDDEDTYPKDEIDLRIVTGFAWDEVQVKDRHRRFIQTDCVNGEDGRYGNYAYNLPRNPLIDMTYGWSRAKVLSKRDTSDIDVPAGWLDGTSGIDKYFP
jgi:hypothetical protein